jgi:hypothetical protein
MDEGVPARSEPKARKSTLRVSGRKREANRRSAQRSTRPRPRAGQQRAGGAQDGKVVSSIGRLRARSGPKTKQGKARVSRNPIRHGIFAKGPVILHVERVRDWKAHLAGVFTSLSPVGHLEEELAHRAAELLWRLRRVAPYEAGSIIRVKPVVNTELDKLISEVFSADKERQFYLTAQEQIVESGSRMLELLKNLRSMRDEEDVDNRAAMAAVRVIAEVAGVTRLETLRIPGIPQGVAPEVFSGWTAQLLREALAHIAERVGKDEASVLEATLEKAQKLMDDAMHVSQVFNRVKERLAPALCLLPDTGTLDNLIRYEAHLKRQLVQTLNTLEARSVPDGARAGGAMSAAGATGRRHGATGPRSGLTGSAVLRCGSGDRRGRHETKR